MADVTPINVQIPRLTSKPQGIIKKSVGVGTGALTGGKIGSVFGPIGSVVGAAVGALGSLGVQALQNRYNRKQTDKAWRRNLVQWNRENEYNDPSAQMERLRLAGLNPNLMYANASGANTSASSPNAEYSNSTTLDEGFFNKFVSLAGLKNQIDQTRSVIDLQDTQGLLNRVNATKGKVDTEKSRAEIMNILETNAGIAQDNLTKAVEYADKKFNLGLSKRLAPYQISAAMWQNELTKYNLLKADMSIEAYQHEIDNLVKTGKVLDWQSENANRDNILKQKQEELYQEQIRDAWLHNRAYQLGTQWLPDDIAFGRWNGRYQSYNQAYWGAFGSRLFDKTPISLKYQNRTYSKGKSFSEYK